MTRKEVDQLGQRLKTISGDIKLYIEKRVELVLLNIGEHFSRILAEAVQKIAGILLLSGAAICLLVALALYLGDVLNNESLGYVLVSLPLIVFGLLFLYLKPKRMLRKIQNQFEKEVLDALSANGEEKPARLQLRESGSGEEVKS